MTSAHFPLERLARDLRSDGHSVVVHPGAQGRSARRFTAGYYMGCQGSAAHHTGSSGLYRDNDINYLLRGRGEGFVISNAYIGLAGIIDLIASGPTYTEGVGGPIGLIPANRGNDTVFSNEIAGGLGGPFTEAQQDSTVALHHHVNRIAADVWGWPDDPWGYPHLFSHHEWRRAAGRSDKIDPAGRSRWAPDYRPWDMDAFRVDARQAGRTGWKDGEGMALHTRDPKDRIADTRTGFNAPKGRVKAGTPLKVGIPATPTGKAAHTAILNVTVVNPTKTGHLQIDATMGGLASDLNFAAGVTIACSTISAVADDGTVSIGLSGGDADIIVDLMGLVD